MLPCIIGTGIYAPTLPTRSPPTPKIPLFGNTWSPLPSALAAGAATPVVSGAPQTGAPGENGLGSVMQCYLESSNVNVVHELVTMIQTQRAYEMNSKAITTSDQMLGRLVQI